MNFMSRTQRAVYMLIAIAQGGDCCTPLHSIEGTSISHKEGMAAQLRRAGIIKSYRGPNGGYRLAQDPKEITIGEIHDVVEPDKGFLFGKDQKADGAFERAKEEALATLDTITLASCL